jgi:hypothetical protein
MVCSRNALPLLNVNVTSPAPSQSAPPGSARRVGMGRAVAGEVVIGFLPR